MTADTWATVDGRQITKADVEKAYRRTRNVGDTPSEEETLAAKLGLLNELIVQELLLSKASALKIDVAQTDLDEAYGKASQNLTPEDYKKELATRDLTSDDMREGLRRELLAQKVIAQEVGAKVTISDKEVSDFYTANRAQFSVPEESYRVAQIVVTPGPEPQVNNGTGDNATTPAAATAKIQMLAERLKGGAKFSDLAIGYSEDPDSAPRGGDLGLIPVSRIKQAPPQMRDAILNKTPGTVNIVSGGGAHTMVLVVAHEQAGQRDLSIPSVREAITENLRGRREQLLRAAYLTAAQSDADIVNYFARRLIESKGTVPSLVPTPPSTGVNGAK